jgi:hypothetical protein
VPTKRRKEGVDSVKELDVRSFQLGMINCFAEMVAVGVKRLAVSPPLSLEEYEELREASEAIVRGSGIHSYLETSLLVTDLQSPEFTRGKWSVLYFKDPETLQSYLTLKKRKQALEEAGSFDSGGRREISREFMRLLSYPEEVIEEKLSGGGTDDPFLLIGED